MCLTWVSIWFEMYTVGFIKVKIAQPYPIINRYIKKAQTGNIPQNLTPIISMRSYDLVHKAYIICDSEEEMLAHFEIQCLDHLLESPHLPPNIPLILVEYHIFRLKHNIRAIYVKNAEIFQYNYFLPNARLPCFKDPSKETNGKQAHIFEFGEFKFSRKERSRSKNLCPQSRHLISRIFNYFTGFFTENMFQKLSPVEFTSIVTNLSIRTIFRYRYNYNNKNACIHLLVI